MACQLGGLGDGPEKKASHYFPPVKAKEMRIGVTCKVHIFTLETEEGIYAPVVEASPDPKQYRCKNTDDQISRRTVP